MNRFEQDRLLREILSPEDLRSTTLQNGLSAMRRAQRRRRIVRFALSTCLLCALVLGAWMTAVRSSSKSPFRERQAFSAHIDSAAVAQHQNVKRITDEDLFALFPDRSMALIGQPGHQQLVFLDLPGPELVE